MKILKFIVSGGSAFATNLVFLYVFTEFFGWWYLFSSVLAFTISMAVGFSLNKFWTYLDHSTEAMYTQMSWYLAINIMNLCLNLGLLYVLVEHFNLWYILAQAVASVILAVESFFLYGRVFAQKPAP